MTVASNPPTETERLRVLREQGLLDTPSEAVFDDLVALAARMCDTPISLISLIDDNRQWFKARYGVTESETPRSVSICAHAVNHSGEMMIVSDATRDSRFSENPLVTGVHRIRFYAGVPLRIRSHAIGTLCVMDRKPRQLTPQQQETLRLLARQVTSHIELRRARAAAESSEARYQMLFRQNPIPLYVFEETTLRFLAVNDAAIMRYGYTEEEFLGMTLMDIRPPEDKSALERELGIPANGLASVGRWRHRKKDGTLLPVDIFAHDMIYAGRNARIVLALDATEQERALAAFRASEERFRALSEAAPLGIFECDAEGSATYCNPAFLAICGRAAAEVLGRGWIETIHPDDRAFVVAETKRCLPAGKTGDLEHRVMRPDGTMRWVHLLASPRASDAPGGAGTFVGTVEDISEKRISEIAMLESEERYRKLLLLSPDAHFVHVDGTVTMANQAFCKLLGAGTPDQIVGRSLFQIVHPDFHNVARERQQLVLDGHTAPPLDQKFIRLDGKVVEVEVSASAVATDGRGRREIQVIARDSSTRKSSESALRDSEERFKLVARAVSDVVWDWNMVTKTVWRSDSYETIFGLSSSPAGAPSDAWASRIHVTDRERVVKSLQHAIASGEVTWTQDYRFLRRDGSYAFVQDRGQIMRDSHGRAIRMVGGMTDLSERKKLELQYLRAQRMESIGTLAGGIAHDLNNVLAPILMSIDLLKLTIRRDSEEFKLLNTIQTSTRRGADLVKQVLSFARGLDGQRVAVNLRHLLTDLERIIGETFPRNITIINDAVPDLWPVLGDPTQIHQVLLNLALNSRDAMPDGGTLTFSAVNFTADTRFVSGNADAKNGSYIVLCVHDTGMGIAPEIRDRVFEPFFTTKEVGKGTGLGLSTVHAIVKSHGGFINLFSEVGHGTTFKIYLPADLSVQTTRLEVETKEIPRGRGELVLVIDDEASIRQITRQTLEAFGYRVRTANDGAEAVAVYPQIAKEVSLVLTDMMMPVMDGQATIQVLRRLNPAVKIVAASGLNASENIARAAAVGVKDFLAKPYTAETMLRLVRAVLDRGAAVTK